MKMGLLRRGLCLVLWLPASTGYAQTAPLPFETGHVDARTLGSTRFSQIDLNVQDPIGGCGERVIDVLVRDAHGWAGVSQAAHDGAGPVTVEGLSNHTSLVVVRCRGQAGYTLAGPFLWRTEPRTRTIELRPRRTVRFSFSPGSDSRFAMAAGQGSEHDGWPSCRAVAPGEQECVGVPLEARVLAVATGAVDIQWGLALELSGSIQKTAMRPARWGRVIRLVDLSASTIDDLTVRVWRQRVDTFRGASAHIRLRPDQSAGVYWLDPTTVWVTTQDDGGTDEIVEVKGTGIVTVRVRMSSLRRGDPDNPFLLYLRSDASVAGVVSRADGLPARGALVTAFEWVANEDAPNATGSRQRWIAESVADDNGDFALSGLAPQTEYQFTAAHPTSGRVSVRRLVDGRPLRLTLTSTPRVRGRVLVAQLPAQGVEVRVVPDRDAFVQAVDPLALMAVPGRTDRDGRFELALPEDGAGEVVVGGNGLAKVRYQLRGSGETAVNDLGDIQLPPPLTVTVRLVAPGCELQGVGPVGSLGLEVVRAVVDPTLPGYQMVFPEPGFWWLEARCGVQARPVQPPVLQLGADDRAKVVELRLSDVVQ